MKIKNILISQPAPAVMDKSPFYEIIKKYNLAIDFNPFIRVVGVTLKEFRSQRVEVLSHSAVIFTSRAMIDNFFRICEEARITIPESMKYFCNSEAVALYLQKYIVYRKRKIFFADSTFAHFMELILKHKDENFLLTLTEPSKPEIPHTMESLGLRFSRVVLAKTVTADLSGVDINKYDMVVLYSNSDVTALKETFGAQESLPRIATFGTSTAEHAVDQSLEISVMAPTAEAPSMVKALDIYIKKYNLGQKIEPVVVERKKLDEEFIKAQESKPRRRKSASVEAAKQ